MTSSESSTSSRRRPVPLRMQQPPTGRAVAIGAVLLVFVIALVVWIAGATYQAVPVDKIALHYTGGPIQGTHFVSVVQPGTRTKYYGEFDHVYYLPATQRTYIITANPKQG